VDVSAIETFPLPGDMLGVAIPMNIVDAVGEEVIVAALNQVEHFDLWAGQWNIPKLRELLEDILPARSTFRDFEVTHEFERVGCKVMLLNASEIFDPNAQARTILLAIEDATERKRAEKALTTTNAELQHFAYALTHDLQEPIRMVANSEEPRDLLRCSERESPQPTGTSAPAYIPPVFTCHEESTGSTWALRSTHTRAEFGVGPGANSGRPSR